MRFVVICSKKDLAGINIYDKLLKKGIDKVKNTDLILSEEETIFLTEVPKADYLVFATRHQSKSGEKTLSIHFPGNFNKAEYGGKDKKLCTSAPILAKQAFQNLNKLGKDSGYLITLEATHHGPNLKIPCFFIEIGSKKEQWEDTEAGNIIAETIIQTIINFKPITHDIAICFGGLHYCANFNKIELDNSVAMSHICPKYNIENIDTEIVKEMIDSTQGKVNYALLDWKGLNSVQKNKLLSIFEELGLSWKKTKDI